MVKYDRRNAFATLPQLEKRIDEVEKNAQKSSGKTTECPFPPGVVLPFADDSDPNEIWQGTEWQTVGSNCYLVGAGTHSVGTSGGSNTRSASDIPLKSHTHTINHGHGHTNPTVSVSGGAVTSGITGGAVTGGITGGSHSHQYGYNESMAASGSVRRIPSSRTGDGRFATTETTHTHNLPSHTHNLPSHNHTATVSGGGVSNYSGSSGSEGGSGTLNIEPAYYSVALWQRVA